MDSTLVIYTGGDLPNITVVGTDNDDLQTILGKVNTAIGSSSTAPDYSGYNLRCVTQVDGTSHPTNTQNFAEGISKVLCDLKTSYTTFTGTTYVTNQSTITTAITNLQNPALTFSAFGISNTDPVGTVWTKTFTGIGSMLTAANPSGASWSTLSITPPTTVTAAFNDLITYLSTLNTTVSGKQASVGTWDNTGNCLAGGATDSLRTTIDSIISHACGLSALNTGSVTWGCVTPGTNLQTSVQNIISALGSSIGASVTSAGAGLTLGSIVACTGRSLAVDTTWSGLYKVAISSGDVATADYLVNKIESTDASITISTADPTKLNLSVTTPVDHKVNVASGGTPDYLANKLTAIVGDWGMAVIPAVVSDQVTLRLSVVDPILLAQTLMSTISGNQDLLSQFCALKVQCDGCLNCCSAATNLLVSITTV